MSEPKRLFALITKVGVPRTDLTLCADCLTPRNVEALAVDGDTYNEVNKLNSDNVEYVDTMEGQLVDVSESENFSCRVCGYPKSTGGVGQYKDDQRFGGLRSECAAFLAYPSTTLDDENDYTVHDTLDAMAGFALHMLDYQASRIRTRHEVETEIEQLKDILSQRQARVLEPRRHPSVGELGNFNNFRMKAEQRIKTLRWVIREDEEDIDEREN